MMKILQKISVDKLEGITHKICNDYYKKPKPLKLTPKEKEEFDFAEIFVIFAKKNYVMKIYQVN